MKRPRDQHYVFAHRVLPSLFFANPEKFISTLNERGDSFLRLVWLRVGESVDNVIAPDNLSHQIRNLDTDTTTVLITLPLPKCMTEAYLVALVHRSEKKDSSSSQEPLTRYIALEYGIELDGSPRTVLCEWTAEGIHRNMGNGPEPTLEAFFTAVRDLVSKDLPEM